MTDRAYIEQLRTSTKEHPLKILMSACLTGIPCGWDGTAYGEYPSALKLLRYDTVKVVKFCPEEFSFGSPREMCDIHGGTGFDVLDGKAKCNPMSNTERILLKEKIKRAIKISSQKLIEKKKALGQKLVISENGKIRIIDP